MKTLRSEDAKQLISRYNEIEKQLESIKPLLKEQKAIKAELIKLAAEKQDDSLKIGNFLLMVKKSISMRFNQKYFIEVNGQQALDQYKKESESVSLLVKEL